MIEWLSEMIALRIKNASPEKTTSVPIMVYALSILLNSVFTTVVSLLIGIITSEFIKTLITLISFNVLRLYTSGFHFKSMTHCFIVTTIIVSITPHLSMILGEGSILLITLISAIIVLCFAPNHTYDKIVISRSKALTNKLVSFLIICTNFLILSQTVALTFFVVAILLLPKGGE